MSSKIFVSEGACFIDSLLDKIAREVLLVGACYDPYRPHIFEYSQHELANIVSRHKLRVKMVIGVHESC